MPKKLKKFTKDEAQPITASDLKANLAMIGREYMKTEEFKKEQIARWQPFVDKLNKELEDMEAVIKKNFVDTGIVKNVSFIANEYMKAMKFITPPKSAEISYLPPRVQQVPPSLTKEDLERIANLAADRIATEFKKVVEHKQQTIIFLTKDGDLYRNPKEKYSYPMRKEGIRLAIMRSLGSEFKKTSLIKEESGSKNTEAVREAVREINRKAEHLLGLKDKLIDSKNHSGYRINPVYQLEKL